MNTERKLATIRRIEEITPIPDADAIECARVGGWRVVVKKGEYAVNGLAVYVEIDAFVPNSVAPFLTKAGHEPKEYEGVVGERLRTVKLRGQISQGLLLPLYVLANNKIYTHEEGADVTEQLGIVKWERPEPAGRNQEAKGNFPHFIKKTDQERVQNIKRELADATGDSFEVTIKQDGSSCTVFCFGETNGVCSRNVDLKDVEGNAFWDIAKKLDLHKKIRATGRNLAVQGELIAPNIQSNYEKVNRPEWNCFSIWDIDNQTYLLPKERRAICAEQGIPHIKVFDEAFVLDHSCDELLAMAEGEGVNPGVKREGLVFKSNTSQFSFKAISNSYLLKEK